MGLPEKIQLVVRAGLELGISKFQIRRPNHSATLPPNILLDVALRVYVSQNNYITLFKRAFKMMKNGVYFIVVALSVAELFKILGYAN